MTRDWVKTPRLRLPTFQRIFGRADEARGADPSLEHRLTSGAFRGPLKNRSEPRIDRDAATKHEYARPGFQTWMRKGRGFIHLCKSVFICGSRTSTPKFSALRHLANLEAGLKRQAGVCVPRLTLPPIDRIDTLIPPADELSSNLKARRPIFSSVSTSSMQSRIAPGSIASM
jgi:hypothetical protein